MGLVVGFEVMFEHAVFALEVATGGGEVAQDEVVGFDFFFRPHGDGRVAVDVDVSVVLALDADAVPFGLSGFEDEGVEERVFGGVLVGVEPGLEQEEPVALEFVVHDEGAGAHAVFDGVAGGGGTAFGGGYAGSAGIAFWRVFRMVWGGFERIGNVFERLSGGIEKFVFERNMFTHQ